MQDERITRAEQLAHETVEIMRSRITDAVRFSEAYEGRSMTLVVDGSMYSPSTRALPNASLVWDMDDADAWTVFDEIVCDALDQTTVSDGRTDSEHPEDWTVGWEDGCLFAYAPEYEAAP